MLRKGEISEIVRKVIELSDRSQEVNNKKEFISQANSIIVRPFIRIARLFIRISLEQHPNHFI